MTKIFISYRRDDAAGYAGWLTGLLRQRFGDASVFIDVESIEAGDDFVANIEQAVASCDVLIALVGGTWLEARKADGTRRIDDPRDFLRLEIVSALARDVRVIPALIHGAVMPAEDELPDALKPLARRNAIELSDTRFGHDVARLIGVIERTVAGETTEEAPADQENQPEHASSAMLEAGGPPVASAVTTCLIADIRDYTRYTLEQGDEAAARLAARFAEIAEEAATRFGGFVIELRGDEVLAVFSSPRNSLRAAVALQERCAMARREEALPLDVGVGLDAGELVPVRDGYRGAALNRAARLCSIAPSGTVFATEGVVHLAGRTEGIDIADRDTVSLKGLAQPVRVMQIAAEGTISHDLPPLRAADVSRRAALPDESTPFIGRERELDAATRLLADPSIRLLTLTGPGGTGKTRLALRLARNVQGAYRDGAVFVPLSAVTDPALVTAAIAAALELRQERERPLLETVIAHLRNKHLLLLLDSIEHLLAAAPDIGALLDACLELNLLVTSRIPLRLAREHEMAVPPLAVPTLSRVTSPEAIERYDAVALFLERAQAVKPEFRLSAANAADAVEICARLDGLPLALELAAARIRLFPPGALLQRLSNRLALLTGGARDRPSRQQTLRGTIDWSYTLLSAEEQTVFARLGVFAGSCTFEAAEAVCFEGVTLDALDGMTSLVEQSMVRQTGEEPRFTMLDTIREYAAERLAADADAEAVRLAHARYFLQLTEDAEPLLVGPTLPETLLRLDREHDNLRVALAWALDTQPLLALRLAAGMRRFWEIRGHLGEGRHWLDEALRRASAAPAAIRGQALLGSGTLARCQADFPAAQAALSESLELFRNASDTSGIAAALGQLGLMTEQQGELERAQALHEESLALRREIRDRWGVATALNNLGLLVYHRGEHDRARDLFAESLALNRELHDQRGIRIALNSLGMVYEAEGELGEAERFYRESLDIGRLLGDRHGIAYGLINLGLVAVKREDTAGAVHRLSEGLDLISELGDRFATVAALSGLAQTAVLCGDGERGVTLLAATETLLAQAGIEIDSAERQSRDTSVAQAHTFLSRPAFDSAWKAGSTLSLEAAIAVARDIAAGLPEGVRAPSPAG